MELDTIIINLKVIASLEVGQKLNTKEQFLNIECRSLIPESIRRWYRVDTRDLAVRLINITVNNAICQYDKNPSLKRYLEESVNGLHNLQSTYSTDRQTVSRIDTMLDKISTLLQIAS